MKKLLTLIMVLCSTSTYADWSIKPYVQLTGGVDSYSQTKTTIKDGYRYVTLDMSQVPLVDPSNYLQYYRGRLQESTTVENVSETDFGVSVEGGAEFRYDCGYGALGLEYNSNLGAFVNTKLGFSYDIVTPYVKLGYLLDSDLNGTTFGLGVSVKLIDNVFIEVGYDATVVGSRTIDNSRAVPTGGVLSFDWPTAEQVDDTIAYFDSFGRPHIILEDANYYTVNQTQESGYTSHSFRVGAKYVF
jgi:opacity protein-like surface antigen